MSASSQPPLDPEVFQKLADLRMEVSPKPFPHNVFPLLSFHSFFLILPCKVYKSNKYLSLLESSLNLTGMERSRNRWGRWIGYRSNRVQALGLYPKFEKTGMRSYSFLQNRGTIKIWTNIHPSTSHTLTPHLYLSSFCPISITLTLTLSLTLSLALFQN